MPMAAAMLIIAAIAKRNRIWSAVLMVMAHLFLVVISLLPVDEYRATLVGSL